MAKFGEGGELLKCSFCGKSQKQVKKLIAGPGVYICDECIDLCNEIIEEELAESSDVDFGDLPRPPRSTSSSNTTSSARTRQEDPRRRGLQPLQAGRVRCHARQRGRALEVEHPARRPHRLRQDAARPDPRPHAQRAVRHRRRHGTDRGRLRRRGRREHPPQAAPGRRLRRQEGRDRHHLHRRDRQGRPQEREPVDHPRRVR